MPTSDLARKLGLKPGMTLLVTNPPPDFDAQLTSSPTPTPTLDQTPARSLDCLLAFVRSIADVAALTPAAIAAVRPEGLLWFAYPKKSSPLHLDLSRDTGWQPLRDAGFDSVAQIAIDDTWTGFRFRPQHLIGKRPPHRPPA